MENQLEGYLKKFRGEFSMYSIHSNISGYSHGDVQKIPEKVRKKQDPR